MSKSTVSTGDSPPLTIIEPGSGRAMASLAEIWQHRPLFAIFVWRDIKIRYKQTLVGIAWAWVQPMMLVLVYSIFFGYLARFPSGDFPYPVFVLTGLVVWQFFVRACNDGNGVLVNNGHIMSRLYFPRLILPMSSVVGGLVDFVVGLMVLAGVMAFYRIVPDLRILALPVILFLLLVLSLGAAIWLSMLNAVHRDFGLVTPVVLQVGFFISPVFYSMDLVPVRFHWFYSLNPMVGYLESVRWSLGGRADFPDAIMITSSLACTVVIFLSGLVFFRRNEALVVDHL